jgi:drug/metabolite transporter (DMT)-like permease
MRKKRLTFLVFVMLIMTDIGESIAELLLKKGLLHTGILAVSLDNLLEFIARNASSCLIWCGVAVYVVNFLIWIAVLSRVDLSIALPVASTSYLFVPILSVIFLNEHVSLVRWAGVALIIAGIHFLSRSTRS